MTRTITMEVPDQMLAALNLSPEEAAKQFRLAAAMKLYEMDKLSSGAAADLAGIPRVEFLARLSEFGIDTFRMTPEELTRDTPPA